MIAANILPQAIKEFRSQRSDLRIQLFDADLTTLFQRLEAGNLGFGFDYVASLLADGGYLPELLSLGRNENP